MTNIYSFNSQSIPIAMFYLVCPKKSMPYSFSLCENVPALAAGHNIFEISQLKNLDKENRQAREGSGFICSD